jgi:hypothetical protein
MRRRRRRWRLDRHAIVLVVVVVLFLVLFLVLVVLVVVVVGEGHDGRPVGVPVGVAEVAGALVWAQLPPGEGVPVRRPDVEGRVAPQVHGEEATPPPYLPHAL